jgi:ribosomal protein S18 acetylase RimI-like enzyme
MNMKPFKQFIKESEIEIDSTKNAVGGINEKFVIKKDGKEIAHVKTSIQQDGSAWISAVYVDPEHRNQGLAKKLIQSVINKYKRPINIRVSAYKDEPLKDDQLIEFYRKLGFEQIPNMNKYYMRHG